MLQVIGRQLITPPAAGSDVPAAMREYLNLSTGVDSDTFLSSLYLRAESIVVNRTGLTCLHCTWQLYFSGNGNSLRLPLFPVSAAALLSPAPDGFPVGDGDGVQPSFTLRHAAGCCMELAFDRMIEGYWTVQVDAGYAAGTMPPAAAAAIFAIAADLYEHREAESEVSLTENRAVRMALDSLTFYHAGGV